MWLWQAFQWLQMMCGMLICKSQPQKNTSLSLNLSLGLRTFARKQLSTGTSIAERLLEDNIGITLLAAWNSWGLSPRFPILISEWGILYRSMESPSTMIVFYFKLMTDLWRAIKASMFCKTRLENTLNWRSCLLALPCSILVANFGWFILRTA